MKRSILEIGTFGKVKFAQHIETGNEVAIKILDKIKIQQQNMGSQIKREISLMKMVKNRHIVQLYVSSTFCLIFHLLIFKVVLS